MVRRLCRRSASLMTRTRQSLAMAMIILRIVAACWASLESKRNRSSLVTPSTIEATVEPNPAATSLVDIPVSSTASWRSAATSVVSSRPSSARMVATSTGWWM